MHVELHEIDVFIDKDGQVRLEVRGVKGAGCLEVTAPLEQVLGGHVESREMTSEAAQIVEQPLSDQQRQGR